MDTVGELLPAPEEYRLLLGGKESLSIFENFPFPPSESYRFYTVLYYVWELLAPVRCYHVMWSSSDSSWVWMLWFCCWTFVAGQPDGTSHTTHGMSALAPLTMHKILLFPEHTIEVGLLNIFLKINWLIVGNQTQALKHTNLVLYLCLSTTARLVQLLRIFACSFLSCLHLIVSSQNSGHATTEHGHCTLETTAKARRAYFLESSGPHSDSS